MPTYVCVITGCRCRKLQEGGTTRVDLRGHVASAGSITGWADERATQRNARAWSDLQYRRKSRAQHARATFSLWEPNYIVARETEKAVSCHAHHIEYCCCRIHRHQLETKFRGKEQWTKYGFSQFLTCTPTTITFSQSYNWKKNETSQNKLNVSRAANIQPIVNRGQHHISDDPRRRIVDRHAFAGNPATSEPMTFKILKVPFGPHLVSP